MHRKIQRENAESKRTHYVVQFWPTFIKRKPFLLGFKYLGLNV